MGLLHHYYSDDLRDVYQQAQRQGHVLHNFPLQQGEIKFRELVRRTKLDMFDPVQMSGDAAVQYPDLKGDSAGVQAFFQKEHSRPAMVGMTHNNQAMHMIFPIHATGQFMACELPTKTAQTMVEEEIRMNACDYGRLGRNDLFIPGGWRWRMTMDLRDTNMDLRDGFEQLTGHRVKDDLRDRAHKVYAQETNVPVGKTKTCPDVLIAFYNNVETCAYLQEVPPMEKKTMRHLATQAYKRTTYERLMNN